MYKQFTGSSKILLADVFQKTDIIFSINYHAVMISNFQKQLTNISGLFTVHQKCYDIISFLVIQKSLLSFEDCGTDPIMGLTAFLGSE